SLGSLELIREELAHINLSEASKRLFPHTVAWRKSVIKGRKTSPLISTEGDSTGRVIKQHQDGGSSGRPISRLTTNLPRTVLSVANAAESPTALVVRREMQSWQLLQLEPSALRRPDEFTAPSHLGLDGAFLAATLFRLAKPRRTGNGNPSLESQVYATIANRLSELIEDVSRIWVDLDESRELLTLFVADRNGTPYPARSLSDGTLRFLALAVLEADPEAQGTLCLEEPENGIHPERIPAMLELLRDIATDSTEPVDSANPLRQVIVNTHSPSVVAQIPDDSLLIAELREQIKGQQRFKHPVFTWLPDTWRAQKDPHIRPLSRGMLLSYLNPTVQPESTNGFPTQSHRRSPRVMDREDLQLLLPFPSGRSE
ncbi:MAG: AAA family ATPase, partial [Caldilineaceae bacterium]|nr:AAA family ATPase [Caldilineaceae bacterium]